MLPMPNCVKRCKWRRFQLMVGRKGNMLTSGRFWFRGTFIVFLWCHSFILRCQKEFEKDFMENINIHREKYEQDTAAAHTGDDKIREEREFEQMEMELRRRSLGIIKWDDNKELLSIRHLEKKTRIFMLFLSKGLDSLRLHFCSPTRILIINIVENQTLSLVFNCVSKFDMVFFYVYWWAV